jgi:hypothetical protein
MQVQVRRQVREVLWSVLMTITTRCSVDSQKVLRLLLPRLHTLMVAVAVVLADQP